MCQGKDVVEDTRVGLRAQEGDVFGGVGNGGRAQGIHDGQAFCLQAISDQPPGWRKRTRIADQLLEACKLGHYHMPAGNKAGRA